MLEVFAGENDASCIHGWRWPGEAGLFQLRAPVLMLFFPCDRALNAPFLFGWRRGL